MKQVILTLQIILLVSLNQTVLANDSSRNFRAEDGKVDSATFIGYTTFHSVCVACHGVGTVVVKLPQT